MTLDLRYARSFLKDLISLEPAVYERVYDYVFVKFRDFDNLYDLPELHSLEASRIFYRFTLENYFIGIEVTGQIVKFVRILPKPEL
ncbi:MAG: cytotoxic translational repressor of toxin-antitoxin stability system [Cyanobacteria bacterium J06592_8]